MSDIIVSFANDSNNKPVAQERLPANQPVETRAKNNQHYLQADASAQIKRDIVAIEFPAESTYNVIRILPASPEQIVDTIRSQAPIIEETLIQGGLSGRRLICPQKRDEDYRQEVYVVTPPDVGSAKARIDVEKDLRERPYIKVTVSVKHS
jgi:hypothetical protein